MALNIFDRAMASAWPSSKTAMGEKAVFKGTEVDIIVQTFEVGDRVNDMTEYGGRMRTGGAEIVMSLADWTAKSGLKGDEITVRTIDMRVVNKPVTAGSQVFLQLAPA